MKSIGNIITTIFILFVLYLGIVWIWGKIKPNNWTLRIYRDNGTSILDASIPDFSSKNDCLQKGLIYTKQNEYFYCGSNCDKYDVCDHDCNQWECIK